VALHLDEVSTVTR